MVCNVNGAKGLNTETRRTLLVAFYVGAGACGDGGCIGSGCSCSCCWDGTTNDMRSFITHMFRAWGLIRWRTLGCWRRRHLVWRGRWHAVVGGCRVGRDTRRLRGEAGVVRWAVGLVLLLMEVVRDVVGMVGEAVVDYRLRRRRWLIVSARGMGWRWRSSVVVLILIALVSR